MPLRAVPPERTFVLTSMLEIGGEIGSRGMSHAHDGRTRPQAAATRDPTLGSAHIPHPWRAPTGSRALTSTLEIGGEIGSRGAYHSPDAIIDVLRVAVPNPGLMPTLVDTTSVQETPFLLSFRVEVEPAIT